MTNTTHSRRRIAALVLSISGGLLGLATVSGALLLAGLFLAPTASAGEGFATWAVWLAFFFPLLGIVGGALSYAKPSTAAICQAIAGIGGFVTIRSPWLLPGTLLIAGAVFAWLGRSSNGIAADFAESP